MPYLFANQIQIYYEIYGVGKPILFIHGLGSSGKDWEYQTAFFKDIYQVITFDLRGHGNTDKPDESYNISLFANDTAAVINHLTQQPIHIIGHSLGGMIAFQLALDFPALVKSITIINSGPAVLFPSLKAKLNFAARSIKARLFGMDKMIQNLAQHLFPKPEQAPLRTKLIERWSKNDPKAYVNSLHAFKHWNVMHRLSTIECPTLVIAADQDYSPPAFKEHYVALIRNAELVIIPNSRHVTLWDQPEALNRTLLEFLTRHS